MKILALVLAGGEGSRLYPLTAEHAKPALAFAGGHRLVDCVLSNLVNSGITSIYVLAQYKPHSLIEHIRSAWAPADRAQDRNGWPPGGKAAPTWPALDEPVKIGDQYLGESSEYITETRGNSRAVSPAEFRVLREQGRLHMETLEQRSSPPTGLDWNWDSLVDRAYAESQKLWGGATINGHTGALIETDANRYAVTVKTARQKTVSVIESATREEFARAMAEARRRYAAQLARADHALGVFHDEDLHRIDIDPVLIVETPQQVEIVGAYTHAVGGAYHFASGEGYFPPHVDWPSPRPPALDLRAARKF